MLEVLYEDNHIIAVNKKPSDIVQGDKTGDRPLAEFVKDYIKKKYLLSLACISSSLKILKTLSFRARI